MRGRGLTQMIRYEGGVCCGYVLDPFSNRHREGATYSWKEVKSDHV